MKIGDLVIRKIIDEPNFAFRLKASIEQRERLGHGLVLSRHYAGMPPHWCISVFYPKVGEIYDIAESLMEVISESR
tara:strand:- start:883 stop:1110 length:228 start_codon:yes stop_codon:yes gene_type:complete